MKEQFLILMVVLCGLSYSCQKCELVEQIITYPPVDTVAVCDGTFYILLAESAMDTNYYFYSLTKPISDPLNPVQKAGPFGYASNAFGIRSNFSAFDSINEIYAFEFFRPSNTMIGFYSNQTLTNLSTNSTFLDFYVAPAFQDGHLYVISIDNFTSEFQYSIGEVNPVTGQDGVGLTAELVTSNNPAEPQYYSSAAAENGLVYFLGGTILIEYNSNNNTSRHFDIDPTYDPIDNPVGYFGLEYDSSQDQLVCMKSSLDALNAFRTTIISIRVGPTGAQQSQLFDLASHLPSGHSPVINQDFYSTTFDPCDTTYYITENKSFNPLVSYLFETNLNRQTLKVYELDGLVFGLEYDGSQ